MDGYRFLIERNRLLLELEDGLKRLANLPEEQKSAETSRLRGEFDRRLSALYAEVAGEFPGERKKKARPLNDPH